MKNIVSFKFRPAFAVIAIFLLITACTANLAPKYDEDIVEGLLASNTALMKHFAATSTGVSRQTFKSREDTYNTIIGELDALVILTKSRPIPSNKGSDKVNEYLEKHGVNIIEGEESPSATALTEISETMVKMRNTDRKQGVTATEVAAFKGQVVIYLDQAITYEKFLER